MPLTILLGSHSDGPLRIIVKPSSNKFTSGLAILDALSSQSIYRCIKTLTSCISDPTLLFLAEMSNSSYKDELSEVTVADAGLFLMALCLAIFIISANATTILTIWRTPALRTLANTYVCSLACADMVVGMICILMALFMLPPVRLELFFKHLGVCLLFQGTIIGMSIVSAIHMTLIAIDRSDSIVIFIIFNLSRQHSINDLHSSALTHFIICDKVVPPDVYNEAEVP